MVGDIALALFPFTNLQDAKIRPVLVVADVTYPSEQDWMVCEVTSQPRADVLQLPIGDGDIASGAPAAFQLGSPRPCDDFERGGIPADHSPADRCQNRGDSGIGQVLVLAGCFQLRPP